MRRRTGATPAASRRSADRAGSARQRRRIAGGDSSPFVKAKRAIKRGSYSQWAWRDLTRGKTRVIPKMALEAPPRFPWRSACYQAPAVRGGAAPSPEPPLPQPSKRFARREGSPGSQGESQGRLPTSCQASQKTVPGEGQAADCFTACSGRSAPYAGPPRHPKSGRFSFALTHGLTLLPPLAMMDPTPPHTVAPLSHLPQPQLSTIP